MSERTITTCDVPPCTKTKGEGNHWLAFRDNVCGFEVVGDMGILEAPGYPRAKDCCSEQCLMRALQYWLQKQREMPKEK